MIKLSECGMYKLRKNNQWVWSRCEVSPSGQFVAGADYRGIVHIWDLRNGRKLNEFKHHTDSATHAKKSQPATYHTVHEFHSMWHSHCYVPAVMIQTFIFGMLKVWKIIRRILSLQRLNKATSDRPFKTYTRLTVHKEKSPPLCREILLIEILTSIINLNSFFASSCAVNM
jgi:WD40 repeat protein